MDPSPAAVTGAPASPAEAALWLRQRPEGSWQWASTRQEWAGRLLRGRAADEAPRLLPALYALCGGAHRLAARHAVAAASGEAASATEVDAQALQVDTLREHLRRLWLDGPRLMLTGPAGQGASAGPAASPGPPAPGSGEMAMTLARCPYLGNEATLDDAAHCEGRRWVEEHVFGTDPDEWLAAWRIDPATVAQRWSTYGQATASLVPWPARWLAAVRQRLGALAQPPQPLRVAADPQALRTLATQLRSQSGFALAPTIGGRPAETGCWTRLADPLAWSTATARAHPYAPLWMRHAVRLADIAHLSGPLGAHWLAQGALATGEREGLGWCEMARGLLVHWVRLGDHGAIADYRVLAPTEWNFHPQGAAARWLLEAAAAHALAGAEVPAGPSGAALLDVAQVRAFVAAYDPCVELRIEAMHPEGAARRAPPGDLAVQSGAPEAPARHA
ncbi:MAG: nickel-dependent hydrogenase large subunit [Rubrivivax sp.]|nr:nickel-dependent hydrogenase large subunit [Rubrivivax sp.]